MKILGIIPSRYASTRFPGKPLVIIDGMSMIERVYRQAAASTQLQNVIVATDDDRIFQHVKQFGGNVVLTSTAHQSGTDRCAEVLENQSGYDAVINIQGDEPFIDPKQIDLLAGLLEEKGVDITTLIKKIINPEDLINVNIPKVVIDKNNNAIYFSRHAIPFNNKRPVNEWLLSGDYFKHIGIYGYRASVLPQLTKLPQGFLEQTESLEQLRWIENGYRIKIALTTQETIAIDTPEDLEKLLIKRRS